MPCTVKPMVTYVSYKDTEYSVTLKDVAVAEVSYRRIKK